ncbi:MAG: hypothetical protein KatS3mg068_2681 [Candidatus Sericytochromatia bacterium]|nr:MAG: hypothetical protein KatS3mg068_2681 [Candidatus Sericytochromatia bacterium]
MKKLILLNIYILFIVLSCASPQERLQKEFIHNGYEGFRNELIEQLKQNDNLDYNQFEQVWQNIREPILIDLNDVYISDKEKKELSLFDYAVIKNDKELIELLLKKTNYDFNQITKISLGYLFNKKNYNLIKFLINIEDNKKSLELPLYRVLDVAIDVNNEDLIDFSLEKMKELKINLGKIEKNNYLLVLNALRNGLPYKKIQLLLEYGATFNLNESEVVDDLNLVYGYISKDLFTGKNWTFEEKNKIVDMLINAGLDIKREYFSYIGFEQSANVPFLYFVINDYDFVRIFIDKGAEYKKLLAVTLAEGELKVAEYLINKNADVNNTYYNELLIEETGNGIQKDFSYLNPIEILTFLYILKYYNNQNNMEEFHINYYLKEIAEKYTLEDTIKVGKLMVKKGININKIRKNFQNLHCNIDYNNLDNKSSKNILCEKIEINFGFGEDKVKKLALEFLQKIR